MAKLHMYNPQTQCEVCGKAYLDHESPGDPYYRKLCDGSIVILSPSRETLATWAKESQVTELPGDEATEGEW